MSSSIITRDDEGGSMLPLMIDGILIRRDVAGRYSLNDLHKAGMAAGKATESQRPGNFLKADGVQRFIDALEARTSTATKIAAVRTVNGGKNPGTYAAELVAIRYAAWIDSDFEVGVYLTFQAATRSRDTWTRERARLAAAHSVMSGMLHDKRAEAGKGTDMRHYVNESRLVNWALCGEFKPLERDAMSAADLVLLAQLETRNAVLIGRGLSYNERKHQLGRHALASRPDRLAINGEDRSMTATTIPTQAPTRPTSARGVIRMAQRTQRQPKTAQASGVRRPWSRPAQVQPQGLDHLHDGGELGVAIGRQRPVEPFARQAGIFRKLGHAARAGNGAQRLPDKATVAGVIFDAQGEVVGAVLFGLEVIGAVPAGKLLGHASLLPVLGQRHGAGNVGVLGSLVTATQQHQDHRAGLDEIDPVAGAVVDAEFLHAIAGRLHIAHVPIPHSVYANLNAQARHPVPKPQQPALEGVGFDDLEHGRIVIHGLQVDNQRQPATPKDAHRNRARLCYSCRKPKGPVRKNTLSVEVAAPTLKRGFVVSEFVRSGVARCGMVYGQGGGYPQGRPHGYGRVLNHLRPPAARKNVASGFLSLVGAKSMTQVYPLVRPVAPVPSQPGRRAARTLHLSGRCAVVPTPPAHGTPPPSVLPPEVAALVAQAQITLAGSLALLQSGVTAQAVHQATGRAIRSATLLKRACGALAQGAAA